MMEEEPRSNNLQRWLSENSADDSDDSDEYYDIYELLPSTMRRRQYRDQAEGTEGPGNDPSPFYRDWDPSQPLKTLPLCMQEKRNVRYRRHEDRCKITYWQSWKRSQEIARRRVREQMGRVISRLLLWKSTLHNIEGRFGVGVKAYFEFLRYLFCLNLLNCVIICCVITPFLYNIPTNKLILDIFLGSGFMEHSPVFYGFYTNHSVTETYKECFNAPLIYFFGMVTILFFSLVLIVHRTVVGYKDIWLTGNSFRMNLSFKVFCGWDFNVRHHQAAFLKQSLIRNELKMDLEEQNYKKKVSDRLLKQWILLYFLRTMINIVVLVLLCGAMCLIYYAIDYSKDLKYNWAVNLLLGYLPPLTMTLLNFILPHMFSAISKFEDYSLATQLNLTLVRSITLKLGSLSIYLFFLLTREKSNGCVETEFGKEMYKLTIFQLLASFFNTFFIAFPRKLLVEKCSSSNLARKTKKQEFEIPLNVLDLVYSQTVTWVGVFYCPLLPAISTFKLLAVFYMMRFKVVRCCAPARRMFRTSSSSVLFHFMLLLGLVMSAVILGVSFKSLISGKCGPFQGNQTVYSVTRVCVSTLPPSAQKTIHYSTSEAFAFILILAEIIALTSYVSRGQANRKDIERLKDMLVMSSLDKRFLVNHHDTILRQKKKTTRGAERVAS
ncbi:transmembrane channel-like protein 7 [Trichomycterus rosablanca]|uniref:transmembrane channel-like protein 7 n=1 Tax=Trichomycterus rosablanca TaxID=2290929 RepID=UPI002F35B955